MAWRDVLPAVRRLLGNQQQQPMIVEQTEWQEIGIPHSAYSDVRHTITRSGGHYWTELEIQGDARRAQQGPFPSMEEARAFMGDEIADLQSAWADHIRAQDLANGFDEFDDHIRSLTTSDWNITNAGADEYREHIGISDDGYHYAVETSHLGGDDGFSWSPPFPTRAAAEDELDKRTWALVQGEEIEVPDTSILEVRARDFWEDQRAVILDGPGSAADKAERLEALGPAPDDDAKIWLNEAGQQVEQPSVELQPIEVERPATEERAERQEQAIGLEQDGPRQSAGLEL